MRLGIVSAHMAIIDVLDPSDQRDDCVANRGARLGSSTRLLAAMLPWVATVFSLSEANSGEGFALMGVGGSTHGLNTYAGAIYAPMNSLWEDGPLLRVWVDGFEYTYYTDLPDEPDARIQGLGYGVQVEAGWQVVGEWGRVALLPGVIWRDHKLFPSDPWSRLEEGQLGLSLTVDGDLVLSNWLGVLTDASFVVGLDEYSARVRPYLHLGDGWKIGLELGTDGGPDYTIVRAGAFTAGYELPPMGLGRMFLGGAAGVEWADDGEPVAPFVDVNIGLAF